MSREESDDPFAAPVDEELSLDLGEGFATDGSSRTSLGSHREFIEASQKRMGLSGSGGSTAKSKRTDAAKSGSSSSDVFESDRRLYWMLTRVPVLLILGWFTLSHLVFGAEWVFIDGVNLLFHEAGHVVFRFAGDTIWFLGGGLLQLLLPALAANYFYFMRGERFGAIACVWWVGENFLNIARYMYDAPLEELPLVGGDIHDWNYLFSKWDRLHQAQEIAEIVRVVGITLMVGSLLSLLYMTIRPSLSQLEKGV